MIWRLYIQIENHLNIKLSIMSDRFGENVLDYEYIVTVCI